MFSISFLCRESKMDKRGYSPVEMSIILDGKRTYMVLPRKERPSIFRKEYMARGKNELKEFCDEFYRRVNTSVSEMYRKGLVVSSKGIKAYMRGDYETVYSVSMLCAGHSNIAMTNKYTHLVCEDVVRAVSERL